MATRTRTVTVRCTNSEYRMLKARAKREGVKLGEAMRQGAQLYFAATEFERETLTVEGAIRERFADMVTQVEKAHALMQSLDND